VVADSPSTVIGHERQVVMSDRGAVFDLGYRPHDGPRLGRGAAIRATIKDGVRRVLGLRRNIRKRIFPWLLFAIALLPAVVFVGIVFFTSQFTGDLEMTPFASHSAYFDLAGVTVLLFAALAGPELLIPDRTEGVLSVYASRPLTGPNYLAARAGALVIVLAGFLLLPQLLLYFGFAALEPGGFGSNLASSVDEIPKFLLTTFGFVAGYGAPAFLVAATVKRTSVASGIYVAAMFVLEGVAAGLVESGRSIAGVLALVDHPVAIRDAIYSETSDLVVHQADLSVWVSIGVVAVMVIAAAVVSLRRYRRLL
jgi:ABC-2 type transport system permease protein